MGSSLAFNLQSDRTTVGERALCPFRRITTNSRKGGIVARPQAIDKLAARLIDLPHRLRFYQLLATCYLLTAVFIDKIGDFVLIYMSFRR